MEKGKKLEWLMAVILLSAAYVLSREGARLVAAQKAATKVVVLDSGHGGDDGGGNGQGMPHPCGDDAGRGG